MNFVVMYILSQIFIITYYTLVATTYYAKNRNRVLVLNFLAIIAEGMSYILLGAWTGLAMCIVALVRNMIFLIDEKKNGKREKINKTDIIILVVLYVILVISTIPTYDGFLSLLSVFATALYTFSVWQKKTNVYKLLGIPTGILYILYNIYIMSIFGIILETILLICSITGYLLEIKNMPKTNSKRE